MSDRDIAAAAEIVTGNAFRALRQQAKGLRRQAQRIKRLRAEAARLETEAVRLHDELIAAEYGHEQCHAELLKAEAEVAALRKAISDHNQGCEQACGTGDDEGVRCGYRPYFPRRCPECPRDWMIEVLTDAALAKESRSE